MMRPHAAWAVHRRNLALLARQHTLVAQTLILPTAILLLVAFVFGGGGGGDAWPVALVDEADTAESREVTEALERSRSRITPYFALEEMSLDQAMASVRDGRRHLLVRIPGDLSERPRIETATYNVNTDAMKNVRLRLDHAIASGLEPAPVVRAELATAQDHDVWRSAYIGGSSVLLALLLGSTLVAANLFAFEREHRTRTAAMLTPLGPATAGAGIIATAVVVALAASLLPLGVSVWWFNLDVSAAAVGRVYAGLLPALVGCAGVGILLGQVLRSFRHGQPVIVVGALLTFFGAGGFAGVAMLHPALQAFADWWLPSRFFTWGSPVLHGFADGFAPQQVAALLAAALVGVLATVWAYRRERRAAPQVPTS